MKNILKNVSVFLMSLVIFACGNNDAGTENVSEGNEEVETYKIAVLLSGFRGDGAYNDYVYEGVEKAEQELPVEINFLESSDASDWENNLIAMASSDYDLIMGASNQFQDIIAEQAPNFPDVDFAMVDGEVNQENVVSVTFSFGDGGFLAGAAAAIIAEEMYGGDTVGFIGAMDIPIMAEFNRGVEAGVNYINPNLNVISAYAGTFNDPTRGKELAYTQFDQGAEIIVQSAAGTGNGILEVGSELDRYVIGLDVMQEGAYGDNLATSVYRHIGDRVYEIISDYSNGEFSGGETLRNEVSTGMVSLDDWDNFKNLVGDDFPEGLEERIEAIEEMFVNGELVLEDGEIVEK